MFRLYHPNGKGTGSAVNIELDADPGEPGYVRDPENEENGSILVSLAPQKSVGRSCSNPRFDWEHRIDVGLSITDIAEFLQVFRGCQESIADGKGLSHTIKFFQQDTIRLEHRIEPRPGYLLDVTVQRFDPETIGEGEDGGALKDGEPRRVCFFFSNAEALALSIVLEQGLGRIAFNDVDQDLLWRETCSSVV